MVFEYVLHTATNANVVTMWKKNISYLLHPLIQSGVKFFFLALFINEIARKKHEKDSLSLIHGEMDGGESDFFLCAAARTMNFIAWPMLAIKWRFGYSNVTLKALEGVIRFGIHTRWPPQAKWANKCKINRNSNRFRSQYSTLCILRRFAYPQKWWFVFIFLQR